MKKPVREALALRSASRHPGRSTLPREPCSLRRASGFSHEYLLLSPRSALAHVPARAAPSLRHLLSLRKVRHVRLRTKAFLRKISPPPPGTGPSLSVLHFRGHPIRRASCYALLRWFQLPWPHPRCLHRATLFVVSLRGELDAFAAAIGSSHIASPAYQEWPTERPCIQARRSRKATPRRTPIASLRIGRQGEPSRNRLS